MKKFLLLIAIFLCASQAHATLSVIQNTKVGATTCSPTCTLTVPSSQSGGNSFFVLISTGNPSDYISTSTVPTCTSCGTWVVPSGCEVNQSSNLGISCAYLLASPTSAITSVAVTMNASSSGYYFYWYEVAFTLYQAVLDVGPSTTQNGSSTSSAIQALTTTGASGSEAIFQAIALCCSVTITSPATPYNTYALIGTTNFGAATAALGTSTSGFNWGLSPTHAAAVMGIAFKETAFTCATPVFGTIGKMYDVSLPQSTTITSGCTYACYSFTTTPTSSVPPTCDTGTQITDGSSVTIPLGSNTLQAIGVQSGDNVSATASAPYNIRPTLGSFNGKTVGNISGNAYQFNGVPFGIFTAGNYNSVNAATATLPTVASMLFDAHGGTSGNAPTTTTLGNSTYATGLGTQTWSIGSMGASLKYTNVLTLQNLLQPVNIAGTAYNQSGSLGVLCTTGVSNHCGIVTDSWATTTTSVSLGFWIQTNCAANVSVDCAAQGGLAGGGGVDYAVVHFNPGPGGSSPCNYNGIEFEDKGNGGTGPCLTYTNNALYRINLQLNEGEAAITSVFTNGSAVILGTNTLAVNQAVQLSTSGSLPTNFAITTTYYVVSTGLSGTAFELAATQGGTPIVAGSAGSGTQTTTIFDQMTVCTATGSLLGNIPAPAYTTPETPSEIWIGPSGEEPSVAGPTFYYYGYVVDTTGQFSATGCIL